MLNMRSSSISEFGGRGEEMKKMLSVTAVLLVVFGMIVSVHATTWLKEDVGNAPGNVKAIMIGDPDNDGDNEIVSGDAAKQIIVYKKVADTWGQLVVISDAGATIMDLEIGDADNDVKNEIVVVTGEGDARVLVLNGSGNSWTMHVIDSIMAGYGTTITIGDADNDGENEIVVGTTDSDLYLYEGSGDSWTKRVLSTDLEGKILGIAIGDADNDDNNEIIAGSYGKNLYMFYGAGSSWTNVTLGSDLGWPVRDVAIGDADNDGENEIVVGAGHYSGYGYSSGGAAYLYKFISGAWYKYNMGSTGSDYYIDRIGVHDIDDDGDKEVVAGWGSGFYYRYGRVKLGNGSYDHWDWTEVTYTICGTQDATRFCVRDLDGDNLMDMVFAETGRQYIRVIHEEDLPEIPEFPNILSLLIVLCLITIPIVLKKNARSIRSA